MLQVMSPSERAAFLLHDIFGFGHAEVATVLHRSESAVRQIVHRARERARAREPRFGVSSKAHAELEHAFSQASGNAPAALPDLARVAITQATLHTPKMQNKGNPGQHHQDPKGPWVGAMTTEGAIHCVIDHMNDASEQEAG